MRHQPVIARESARVGGVAGFEPAKNSIVVARPYHYTRGPLPTGMSASMATMRMRMRKN